MDTVGVLGNKYKQTQQTQLKAVLFMHSMETLGLHGAPKEANSLGRKMTRLGGNGLFFGLDRQEPHFAGGRMPL